MKKRFLLGTLLAFTSYLHAEQASPVDSPSKMFIGAYGGYEVVSGTYNHDGRSVTGRLTLGVDAWNLDRWGFGFEGGFQSGNTMRLSTSDQIILDSGGLPIQATLKPFVDFLASVKCRILSSHPLFVFVKGGFAFRQLQLENRSSSSDHINRINGEIQGGFSYQLTPHGRISISYQGIISNSRSGIKLSENNDILLRHIPTQQGALIGIEYSL